MALKIKCIEISSNESNRLIKRKWRRLYQISNFKDNNHQFNAVGTREIENP